MLHDDDLLRRGDPGVPMTPIEFLAAQQEMVEQELRGVILNQSRWRARCEDRSLLIYLAERAHAPDFSSMQWELERVATGQARVPGVSAPREKAAAFLRDWAGQIADQGARALAAGPPPD